MHKYKEKTIHRKHPTHGLIPESNKPLIVFVTVCTRNRIPWLADPIVHDTIKDVWTDASGWVVGKYVIMPDHIHLFAAPGDMDIDLDKWVRYWKSLFTRRHGIPEHRWQGDHWDTRLRSDESYEFKWMYVLNNPVRHGLVECTDDWPFQGEMNILPW